MTRSGERGVAIVVVMLAMLVVSALGAGLVLITSSESLIAANYRTSHEVFYAAEAAVATAIIDLRAIADWSRVLDGTTISGFTDGSPSGTRLLPDGEAVDLDAIVNMANCRRSSACSETAITAVTTARPWGANNPRWRLFAFGWLDDLVGATSGLRYYVVALVADDGAENDGDPWRDGVQISGLPNPGANVLMVRGLAFGPRSSRFAIEVAVHRYAVDELEPLSPTALRLRSWQVVE